MKSEVILCWPSKTRGDVLRDSGHVRRRIVRGLVVEIPNELVDRPLVLVLLLQLPIKKGADGEVGHDRVEQPLNAIRAPHKLPLDSRDVDVTIGLSDDVADSNWDVFHPDFLSYVCLTMIRLICIISLPGRPNAKPPPRWGRLYHRFCRVAPTVNSVAPATIRLGSVKTRKTHHAGWRRPLGL